MPSNDSKHLQVPFVVNDGERVRIVVARSKKAAFLHVFGDEIDRIQIARPMMMAKLIMSGATIEEARVGPTAPLPAGTPVPIRKYRKSAQATVLTTAADDDDDEADKETQAEEDDQTQPLWSEPA